VYAYVYDCIMRVPSGRAFCMRCVSVHDVHLCVFYVSCVNVRLYVVWEQCLLALRMFICAHVRDQTKMTRRVTNMVVS
jgi:hypothetical protein